MSLPRIALALLLAPLLAVVACSGAKGGGAPFELVTLDEVERMLGQPDVSVIDANPRDVFEKSHLPGARHYKAAPFAEVLPAEKSTRLVFYCASPS